MEKELNKSKLPSFNAHTNVDIECIKLISREFAVNNIVFPFCKSENTLYVAMENIADSELIERIRLLTRMNILPCAATKQQISLALKNYYVKVGVQDTVESLKEIFSEDRELRSQKIKNLKDIEDSPIAKLTDFIITEAIMKRASDIHIEPQEDRIVIRYRIDGLLLDTFTLPKDIYRAVITRVKVMSDMDISERRIPQDGKAIYKSGDGKLDLRISSLPSVNGEKIVIRILYKSLQWSKLKNLDFSHYDYQLMMKALKHNHGMILVTGPTGSGKSSTLYAMLGEINSREKNITTIEDPVEISISGINQVNVNLKSGISFASGLRSILRQDPDIIMIGEIRDEDTAAISVRAAITGHLVLSTLHTNDSVSALNRLSEMGIPKYLLGDAIICIIAQRLIRKICMHCKEEYESSEIEERILKIKNQKLYRGRGCSKCNNSGYSGRRAICEVLYLDNNIRRMVLKEENDLNLRTYLKEVKMRSLVDNCSEYVVQGITTFEEFMRVSNGEISEGEVTK